MSKAAALLLLFTTTSFTSFLHPICAQTCEPSGTLVGTDPPSNQCNPQESDCCSAGENYETYDCSPPVTSQTTAILTHNDFEEGGDGGGAPSCDESFHPNDTPVVALSTGWYDQGSRCGKEIVIQGNGRTTTAIVVDECDSGQGCDEEHAYQKPCRNNIVDGSTAVWEALGLSSDDIENGEIEITWSDA